MQISDYIQNFYKNNVEYNNIINTEQQEFETHLKKYIENTFKDSFAKVATENGIKNFEDIFKIKYNPATESLTFRRERILNRLKSDIPFTETYMVNKINEMLGTGTWSYTFSYSTYTLTINSLIPGKGWYNELLHFLDITIPCNISWEVQVYQAAWDKVKDIFATWNSVKDTNSTWQDVLDGEWT